MNIYLSNNKMQLNKLYESICTYTVLHLQYRYCVPTWFLAPAAYCMVRRSGSYIPIRFFCQANCIIYRISDKGSPPYPVCTRTAQA